MFKTKKKITTLQHIHNSSIEELLEECKYKYRWNLEETIAVLRQCSTPVHFATLHRAAFQEYQHPYVDKNQVVTEEILQQIYFELCKAITVLLKDESKTDEQLIEEIAKVYPLLGNVWINRENSNERRMLQSQLEVRWRQLTAKVFQTVKNKQPTDFTPYEKLFGLCKKDDPLILEIAEEINKLL